jgi:hypothetical protein
MPNCDSLISLGYFLSLVLCRRHQTGQFLELMRLIYRRENTGAIRACGGFWQLDRKLDGALIAVKRNNVTNHPQAIVFG